MSRIAPDSALSTPAWCAMALLALVAAVLLLPRETRAQERTPQTEAAGTTEVREVALEADSLAGGIEDGQRVQRLFGNVRMRQDSTQIWSRRVIRYLDRDEILFTGDVLIVDEGDSLRADTVLYNKRLKTGRARGDVRLTDGEVTVRAPSALYYTEEKLSVFEEGVTLIDSTSTLRSEAGAYYSDEERAEFYRDVHLDEERTSLSADSITYFRDTEISIARGSVFIDRRGGEAVDSTTRTLLFGEWAYSDEPNGRSRTEGRPLLLQIRTDSTGTPADTLIIRARTLLTSQSDTLRRLTAIDSVRIWQRDYAAVADSAVFDRIDHESLNRDELRLYGAPMAWFDLSQVSGDTLRVTTQDGTTDSLFVRQNTFVARLDSALGRVNQLKGHHLVGVMGPDPLRRFTVGPNVEMIHFQAEGGEPDGAVQASGDQGFFLFEGSELRDLSIAPGVQGTIYAEEIMPNPFQLEGYRWLPEAKPAKEDLLEGAPLPPGLDVRPEADPDAGPPEVLAGDAAGRTSEKEEGLR